MSETAQSAPAKKGRPVGRPKGSSRPKGGKWGSRDLSVVALARQHVPAAINTLAAIMRDREAPASSRVAAAGAILDRAWGKAPVTVDHTSGGKPLTELGVVERQQLLLAIRQRLLDAVLVNDEEREQAQELVTYTVDDG